MMKNEALLARLLTVAEEGLRDDAATLQALRDELNADGEAGKALTWEVSMLPLARGALTAALQQDVGRFDDDLRRIVETWRAKRAG